MSRLRTVRKIFVLAMPLLVFALRSAAAESRSFHLELKDGAVVGERVIRVKKGDFVRMTWRADKPAELHLHGYDIEFQLEAGVPKSVTFDAYATGRFPVSRHGAGHGHRAVLHIEVHPD